MLEKIREGLYRLEIPLPRNPLRTLNSYIMNSPDRNLIVDTGFNLPECLAALEAGIRELGLDMEKTDVLATHFHADHTGLMPRILTDRSRAFMGRIDRAMLREQIGRGDDYWRDGENRYRREGYPEADLRETARLNPGRHFIADALFEITPLDRGDKISCGSMRWEVIPTPGHTPGHICLYEPDLELLISGDHLLFDITPNITYWKVMTDSLESYLTSLKAIAGLKVQVVLPGHRGREGSLGGRVLELLDHHEKRLADVLRIVGENPFITAYEVASRMEWSIRADSWSDFPPGQRWFAVGESIAHILHLVNKGKLERHSRGDVHTYCLAKA